MTRKTLLMLLLLFCIKKGEAQLNDHIFPQPPKWGAEKFAFPIDFAPNISFSGTEELRFAPGWADNKSNEYWAYTFLWYVKGKVDLNRDTLNSYLTRYYNGLYLSNLKDKTKRPSGFSHVDLKSIHPLLNDKETYEGKITTLDFLTKKPITFNARIHVRNYPQVNRSAILFEIAPQAYSEPVWFKLNNIITGFAIKDYKEY